MSRVPWFLLVLAALALTLVGCGATVEPFSLAEALETQQVVKATASPRATGTPSPTATVGYQATAQAAETARVAAESTAVAAARLMVEATAAHEALVQEQLRMTAEAEVRAHQIWSGTATAALTAVPATQTQQAVLNTQIPAQQALMAGQLTATHEAPTQVVAMREAQVRAQYAPVRFGVEIFFFFSLGCTLLFVVAVVLWRWNELVRVQGAQVPVESSASILHSLDVTHVEVKDLSNGLKINRLAVPCSPDGLTELATAIVSGEKTFGINSWEGSESENFTRTKIKQMRHFLQANKFAESIGGGRLFLNESGKKFFSAWLEQQALPDEYEFDREE